MPDRGQDILNHVLDIKQDIGELRTLVERTDQTLHGHNGRAGLIERVSILESH